MTESIGRSLDIKTPTLMMCAEKDSIVSLEKCKEVFEGLKCEKSMRLFEGSYHEIHNEHALGELLQVVLEWIRYHA
jgi:alpha-beta hydrolase superfamily lysophospholipase